MKIITVLGAVDKRIIVYPLARALSKEHNVVIIADDGAYRRLYAGHATHGTCGRIDIVTGIDISGDLIKSIEQFGSQYDYALVVSNDKVPAGCEYVVKCTGVDRTICPESESNEVLDIPSTDVILSHKVQKDKNKVSINIGVEAVKYLFDVEEQRQLKLLPVPEINKAIANVFSKATGIEQKRLYKLLALKDRHWSKK